jgi:CBS domain-containing protein
MSSTMAPNDQFIRLYEALKTQINSIAGVEGTNMELAQACDRSKRVQGHRSEIWHVRDVRNLIAHPPANSRGPMVLVTPDLIYRTQRLLDALTTVRTANTSGISLSNLFTATPGTKLITVADTMRDERYSHVPILDERKRVIGVFNESAIFDYFVSQTIIELTDTMVVADIMYHCSIDAGHTESFRFIGPGTTEDEMMDALINVEGEFTRIGALFVTPSGKATEPIHRMITIWDVMSGAS